MVNVTEIDEHQLSIFSFQACLDRQKELLEEYKNFDKDVMNINIDSKEGQQKIKSLLWRIVEELGEAMEAFDHKNIEHYHEELIDSLHFTLELLIIFKISEQEIIEIFNESSIYINDYMSALNDSLLTKNSSTCVIDNNRNKMLIDLYKYIGITGNCLKNKGWKKTEMETDDKYFILNLKNIAIYHFRYLLYELDIPEIYDLYDRKSLVNLFRIRSNY